MHVTIEKHFFVAFSLLEERISTRYIKVSKNMIPNAKRKLKILLYIKWNLTIENIKDIDFTIRCLS